MWLDLSEVAGLLIGTRRHARTGFIANSRCGHFAAGLLIVRGRQGTGLCAEIQAIVLVMVLAGS
jgi:hypothetical protein